MSDSTPIGVIEKNRLDELRISLDEYRGHRFVSVRTYTEREDSPEKVPTKRGVTVKPDQVRELIEALQQAEEACREAGLLDEVPA